MEWISHCQGTSTHVPSSKRQYKLSSLSRYKNAMSLVYTIMKIPYKDFSSCCMTFRYQYKIALWLGNKSYINLNLKRPLPRKWHQWVIDFPNMWSSLKKVNPEIVDLERSTKKLTMNKMVSCIVKFLQSNPKTFKKILINKKGMSLFKFNLFFS